MFEARFNVWTADPDMKVQCTVDDLRMIAWGAWYSCAHGYHQYGGVHNIVDVAVVDPRFAPAGDLEAPRLIEEAGL